MKYNKRLKTMAVPMINKISHLINKTAEINKPYEVKKEPDKEKEENLTGV